MRIPIVEKDVMVNPVTIREGLPDGVLCRIKYPVMRFGTRNRNKRTYEKAVAEAVLADPEVQERIEKKCGWGDCEHPEGSSSLRFDPAKTSHYLHKFSMDESTLYSWFDILDVPAGQFINTLLKAGCGVGCSTRADGELEEKVDEKTGESYSRVIPDKYKFIAMDFTANPSTLNSYPVEIQDRVTSDVKNGFESHRLDKKVACALLEGVKARPLAKELLEKIMKDIPDNVKEATKKPAATKTDEAKVMVWGNKGEVAQVELEKGEQIGGLENTSTSPMGASGAGGAPGGMDMGAAAPAPTGGGLLANAGQPEPTATAEGGAPPEGLAPETSPTGEPVGAEGAIGEPGLSAEGEPTETNPETAEEKRAKEEAEAANTPQESRKAPASKPIVERKSTNKVREKIKPVSGNRESLVELRFKNQLALAIAERDKALDMLTNGTDTEQKMASLIEDNMFLTRKFEAGKRLVNGLTMKLVAIQEHRRNVMAAHDTELRESKKDMEETILAAKAVKEDYEKRVASLKESHTKELVDKYAEVKINHLGLGGRIAESHNKLIKIATTESEVDDIIALVQNGLVESRIYEGSESVKKATQPVVKDRQDTILENVFHSLRK